MNDKDKLVTLAIHSFETAQALQRELESNGIASVIQNVGGTIITDKVRVRISASDLDQATKIVEEMKNAIAVQDEIDKIENKGELLVPIDYSDFTLRACRFSFHLASRYKAKVVLFHSFIDPTPNYNIIEDILGEKGKHEKDLQNAIDEIKRNERLLNEQITEMQKTGELANVPYEFVVKKGIPEDEILEYARATNPILIIMGTRGKSQKNAELIGSVTAEIIERSRNPVLAIPENSAFSTMDDIKNIAYATRFEDEDIVAFNKLMDLFSPFKFKVHFIHLNKGPEKDDSETGLWSEIKLSGIKDYFERTYPGREIEYSLIKRENTVKSVEEYVKNNNIDVISLTTHKRSLFVRLFNPSTAKSILFNSDMALLVFRA